MPEPVRTFISVDIPVTDEIKEVIGELKDVRNVRVSPLSQIHITLKFLGDTAPNRIPKLCATLREELSDTERFGLTMKSMGTFPNARNPRVIWIGFEDSEALMSLADKVQAAVSRTGLEGDDKKFSPHVTVARVNGKADVGELLASHRDTVFCRFECSKVNVMKSELSPKGAKHSVMESIELL